MENLELTDVIALCALSTQRAYPADLWHELQLLADDNPWSCYRDFKVTLDALVARGYAQWDNEQIVRTSRATAQHGRLIGFLRMRTEELCRDKVNTLADAGREAYQIIARQQGRLWIVEHFGEQLWIHPESRLWVIGPGIQGALLLAKKLGRSKVGAFYGDFYHCQISFEPQRL